MGGLRPVGKAGVIAVAVVDLRPKLEERSLAAFDQPVSAITGTHVSRFGHSLVRTEIGHVCASSDRRVTRLVTRNDDIPVTVKLWTFVVVISLTRTQVVFADRPKPLNKGVAHGVILALAAGRITVVVIAVDRGRYPFMRLSLIKPIASVEPLRQRTV